MAHPPTSGWLRWPLALCALALLEGCATVFAGPTSAVRIELDAPVTADVTLEVRAADLGIVRTARHARFLAMDLRRDTAYTVTASAPGYEPRTVAFERTIEPLALGALMPLLLGGMGLAGILQDHRPLNGPDDVEEGALRTFAYFVGSAGVAAGLGCLAIDYRSSALWQQGPTVLHVTLDRSP
jgi:hypothetical protein